MILSIHRASASTSRRVVRRRAVGMRRARRADAPRARSRRRWGCRFRSITERRFAWRRRRTTAAACGAEAKTRADESEEEWNDVEDGRRRDYGACVPDVEPEERVTLEEDPAETTTTTKAKKSKTARKKSRRLTDEERANLLATHHTHVMCVFARGMLVRAAASSALLRALVSSRAANWRSVGAASSSSCSTIEVGTLARLVDWFADVIAPPICLDDEEEEEEDEKKKKTRVKDARWRRALRRRPQSRGPRRRRRRRASRGSTRAPLVKTWNRAHERGGLRGAVRGALSGIGTVVSIGVSLEPTPPRAARNSNPSGRCVRPRYPLSTPTCETRATTRGTGAKCSARDARRTARPFRDGCARADGALVRLPEIIFGNRKRTTTADASSSMPYVVAFYHDLGARDVTRKYALAFSQALHHRTPDWKWWEKITTPPERRRDAWREIARQRCERC